MDLYRQVRGGPVEDDETGDYGAARNIAEEHDDPTQSILSFGPLLSYEASLSTSLQISLSIPPAAADFCWSPDVLFACDKLPALKSEEVKTLGSLLGLPSTSLPVGVKDFLVAFESHPDHGQHLRKLAQQLKSLGREDIVSAMHREKAALRWLGPGVMRFSLAGPVKAAVVERAEPLGVAAMPPLLLETRLHTFSNTATYEHGTNTDAFSCQEHMEQSAGPVLPEGHLVRDLVPSLWVPLTVKLSLSHPQGYDWKWLAEQLSIPRDFIDLWQQQGGVPADKVLKAWQVKVSEATVGRLFDLLIEQREDLAAML